MSNPILVVIFLRGGTDGLSLIAPAGDRNYTAARSVKLRVPRKGEDAGHVLRNANADADFRFHGRAKGLSELYGAGELAVIHASGLKDGTRSHFDAEDRMERAAPGAGSSTGGWLGRWLKAAKPEGILPALAVGPAAPDSLAGATDIVVAREIEAMRALPGHPHRKGVLAALGLLSGDPSFGPTMTRLFSLSDSIEARVALDRNGELKPYQPRTAYPEDNELASGLRTIARAIKLDLGLRVASVDFGGWDTHVDQAYEFPRLVEKLSTAMMAFWKDLGPLQERVTVVTMSEFGRRLKSNESGGTDHGHGNAMMVLGGAVKGGRMFGTWPGLENDALDLGADLAITTDYRDVLADVMEGHMGISDHAALFPGFTRTSLGLV
ncbi:MAG: DUF1501 domain-containing protein [Aestuariivirga sp.]